MFIFGISVTLIILVFYSVQGQILSFCEDPIEGQICLITCTTPDHSQDVTFIKTNTSTSIGSCSAGFCVALPPFSISQPTGTTTVLSFSLTRNDAEEWQCDYGSLHDKETLKWGTYPTLITANGFPTSTEITTEQEVDVKLECLFSESPPTVTLYHTDSTSISTMPLAAVTCTSTADVCTDPKFMTYTCRVKISPSDQLDCSETYSLGVNVKISNVKTVSKSSALGTGITYECQTLSTHLDSTSEASQPTLLVPTDGGINSLMNTPSYLQDETMILSSILPTVVETSYLLAQTVASSNIPLYHTSNTYTTAFLISTLITSIFDGFNSLSSSSSSAGNNNNNSFISDILAQDMRSQITTSHYGIVATQKETKSHIDHTPLASFTYMDNLQLSLEISYQPSLFASHLAGVNTLTFLVDYSMQSGESPTTFPTILSNTDTSSVQPTILSIDETSRLNSSSKYITSVDLKSSFDFDSKTKNDTIGTTTSKVIETLTLSSIAESHDTRSAKISMDADYSSDMLKNSPITSFGSTPGTLLVRSTIVDINTSMVRFFEAFEDIASTLSVNSLPTRSLGESETVGIVMSTSVETSNKNTDTLFESSSILSSTSFNHMHESLSLNTGIESDSVYKAISSANSVLFGSFSILPENDSDNVLSTTSDVVVWPSDVSRISLVSLSPIGYSSYDSMAYISTKYMSSISVNSDQNSSTSNTHLSQPKDFVSEILPSISKYFYSSDINTASSSLLVSSSVNENYMITYNPSLTKSSKVIAILVTVVGCILFVAITILVLFVLKLFQCKPRSKVLKTDKKFINIYSSSLSISTGGRRGISLFEKPYGLPTRYYDKTATSWGVNDNHFTCNYNGNWDDIT